MHLVFTLYPKEKITNKELKGTVVQNRDLAKHVQHSKVKISVRSETYQLRDELKSERMHDLIQSIYATA